MARRNAVETKKQEKAGKRPVIYLAVFSSEYQERRIEGGKKRAGVRSISVLGIIACSAQRGEKKNPASPLTGLRMFVSQAKRGGRGRKKHRCSFSSLLPSYPTSGE